MLTLCQSVPQRMLVVLVGGGLSGPQLKLMELVGDLVIPRL